MVDDDQVDLERLAATLPRQGGRGPQRIADVLSQLMAKRGYSHVQVAIELAAQWKSIVGEQIARVSRPSKCTGGVLEVVVENSPALQNILFRKRSILASFKEHAPQFKVRDLKLRIGD